MNEFEMTAIKAKRNVECIMMKNATDSSTVYAELLKNHLNIVKRFVKDCVYDFATLRDLEARREGNYGPFMVAIFYRETGTWFYDFSKDECLDTYFLESQFVAIIEKRESATNDDYSYGFYSITK